MLKMNTLITNTCKYFRYWEVIYNFEGGQSKVIYILVYFYWKIKKLPLLRMYSFLRCDRQTSSLCDRQTFRRSCFSTVIRWDTKSNLIPPLPPPMVITRCFASRRLLTRLCSGCWRACRTCGFCSRTFKLLCKTCVFSKENKRQTIVTSSAYQCQCNKI